MPTPKQVAARKSAKARNVLQAYRRLFSTPDGETVLKDLMKSCYFFQPSIGRDSHETYFNEGQRAVVARIQTTAHLNESSIEQLAAAINAENASDYVE